MSISIGGINLAESIINIEYELGRTQRILDWILQNNNIRPPAESDMKKIEADTLSVLIKKYPQAGISPKK